MAIGADVYIEDIANFIACDGFLAYIGDPFGRILHARAMQVIETGDGCDK